MRLIPKVFLITMLLCTLVAGVAAQDARTIFEEGKALFDRQQYALAVSKLAPLTSLQADNDMVRYASYYYAVSSYESNDAATAKNMFLQIRQRFPGWDQMDEVNFWLGKLSLEEKNYRQGIEYLEAIVSPRLNTPIQQLKDFHFAQIEDLVLLQGLLRENPDQTVLASQYAKQILKLDVAEQDIDQLKELSEKYELSLDLGIDGIDASPRKEIYNVGLFLPFSFREDSVRKERLQKEWTLRFYEGMKVGQEKLAEEGIKINLITFDTRSSQSSLDQMLASADAKELDFIVGPVFQSSVLKVSAFSKEQQINMMNPLSSNSDIIRDNPFAFLYYPSNESLAMQAAEYAKANFGDNRNLAIFYSGLGDRPRADLYKEILEQDSFNVPIFKLVRPQESSEITLMLAEEEEVDKDSTTIANMMAEMDSLREAGVEEWEIYDEEDFVYDTVRILPDSIGHIFVASDFPSLSASTVSAIDAREDTIMYMSSSRWLAAEQAINFGQLERLNSIFTGANWIDYSKPAVVEFRERYELAYNAYPKKIDRFGDSYQGYDIMVTFGRLLAEYGKYFQVGLKRKAYIPGELTDGFDYRFSNDNRYIPMLRVTDSQVVPVPKTSESNDEN